MYFSYITNKHGIHRNYRRNLKADVYIWALSPGIPSPGIPRLFRLVNSSATCVWLIKHNQIR